MGKITLEFDGPAEPLVQRMLGGGVYEAMTIGTGSPTDVDQMHGPLIAWIKQYGVIVRFARGDELWEVTDHGDPPNQFRSSTLLDAMTQYMVSIAASR